jgi:hypothetical protein
MAFNVLLSMDSTGRPRARSATPEPLPDTLVQFLEGDLAMDKAYCERILHGAGQIKPDVPVRLAGNAFSIHMGSRQTTLEPLLEDTNVKPLSLPTAEFLQLIQLWKVFLAGPRRK